MKRQVMGREVVVAVTEGKLDFGTWEQIFYGEFSGGGGSGSGEDHRGVNEKWRTVWSDQDGSDSAGSKNSRARIRSRLDTELTA